MKELDTVLILYQSCGQQSVPTNSTEVYIHISVAKSWPLLCDSSVHQIFQARILNCVAMPSYKGLSYLSFLFFRTLHSNDYIFSLLLFTFLLFTAVCKASSDSQLAFLHFFILGMIFSLSPMQCHEPLSIVHQALCLSDLVP